MANQLFTKAKDKLLTSQIDWVDDTIKVALVDAAEYTPNVATDEFLSVIPTAAIVASSTLTGKSVTNGAADANDVTISTVSGDRFEYLVIYKDTGVAASSPLIALIDSATNLPFSPSGTGILIQWDNGTGKVFSLSPQP